LREDEGGRDVVQRPLRHGLEERKHRRRERRRDASLLDPDHAIAGAHDRSIGDACREAQARSEVRLVEPPRRPRVAVLAEIIELLRRQVEDSALITLFSRGEVQRVANAR
jgi:hypothetical protein